MFCGKDNVHVTQHSLGFVDPSVPKRYDRIVRKLRSTDLARNNRILFADKYIQQWQASWQFLAALASPSGVTECNSTQLSWADKIIIIALQIKARFVYIALRIFRKFSPVKPHK